MSDTISVVAVIKECSLKADGDRLSFEDIKLDGTDPNRINRLVKAGAKVTISIQPQQESLPGTEDGGAGASNKNGKSGKEAGKVHSGVKPGEKPAANSRKNGKAAKPATEKPPIAV